MSDLNYRSLAKLAFETHVAERRKDPRAAFARGPSWEVLTPEEQQAWIRVVEVVVGTVAAADLA